MKRKNAILFPGQGAQYPGMGKDFYDTYTVARETFEEADDLLNISLSKLIFEGSASELTQTKNSQIAIYVTSLAIWRTILSQFPQFEVAITAGLSLGEYTALTAGGYLTFQEGLPLVKARGEFMQEASIKNRGTMAVVLGLSLDTVEEILEELRPVSKVWVANLNCPGQIVLSGTQEGIDLASEKLKEAGAKRVLSLDVSGAFHSELMKDAKDRLYPLLAMIPIHISEVKLAMNVPGDFVSAVDQIRNNLIQQVTSPVLWEKSMRKMVEENVDAYFEIGPGKTLTGINRKMGMSGPTLHVEKVGDLDTVAQHLGVHVAV